MTRAGSYPFGIPQRILTARFRDALVAAITLWVSILPAFRDAAAARDPVLAIEYFLLGPICSPCAYVFVPAGRTATADQSSMTFQPFQDASPDASWPRDRAPTILSLIGAAEKKKDSTFLLMVGASGVGKSHLLQAQVLPRLREHGWTPLCISDYSEFPANLEKK